MNKVWSFTAYFWTYAGFAAIVPLLVLFYEDLEFSGTQIGVLVGLPPIVTLVASPTLSSLADRTGRHLRILSLLLGMGALFVFTLRSATTFPVVLVLMLLINTGLAPLAAFIDTSAMYMLGDDKDQYGRVRLGATIGFGLSAAVAGALVDRFDISAAFLMSSVLILVALASVQKLDFPPATPKTESAAAGFAEFLRQPMWLVFLALATTIGMGMVLGASYFYPYMEDIGAEESMMGIALFVGTMSEVPVLVWANHVLRLMRPFPLLVLATLFTAIRFLAFSFVNSVELVIVLQLFAGLTFMLAWIAGVAFADAHAPEGRKTTAQGLFGAAAMGVGFSVAGLAGGPLLDAVGGHGLYRIAGVTIMLIGAIAGLLGRRLVPQLEPAI